MEMEQTRESESSRKYRFWIVEEFPRFCRVNDPRGLKIAGIRQIHSMSLTSESIRIQKLSCLSCSVNSYCLNCSNGAPKFSPDRIKEVNADLEEESDNDENSVVSDEELNTELDEESENGTDVDSGSDVDEESSSCDDDSEDGETGHEPGDVVWALWYRKWHAAKVLSLAQVPKNLHPQLASKKTDFVIVVFYDNKKITRIHKSKIEVLGEHLVDKQRAVMDPASYSDALADQIYGDS